MTTQLQTLCAEKGMRMTGQRRVIAQGSGCAADHPNAGGLNIIGRHGFRDGRARFEAMLTEHHDHLTGLKTGKVIEFSDPRIEALQEEICREPGFKLVDHRIELHAVPVRARNGKKPA